MNTLMRNMETCPKRVMTGSHGYTFDLTGALTVANDGCYSILLLPTGKLAFVEGDAFVHDVASSSEASVRLRRVMFSSAVAVPAEVRVRLCEVMGWSNRDPVAGTGWGRGF